MSHRKRVRAYWNRIAREKRAATLLVEMTAALKHIFGPRMPREFIYKSSSLLSAIKPERER